MNIVRPGRNIDRIAEDIAFEIIEGLAVGDASEKAMEHRISVFVDILKLRNVNAEVSVDLDKMAHGMLCAIVGSIICDRGSKIEIQCATNAMLRELGINASVNLNAIWEHFGIRQSHN